MNGVSIEEMVGRSYRDLSPESADAAEPYLRKLMERALVHGLLVSSLFVTALAFHGPSLETVLLSSVCAYGFAEHATHHRHPGIPADRLQALTDRWCFDEPRLQPCAGYLATWRTLLAQESCEGLAKSRPA